MTFFKIYRKLILNKKAYIFSDIGFVPESRLELPTFGL